MSLAAETASRDHDAQRVPAATWRRQLRAVFGAWGMPPDRAEVTADVLLAADLMGIDSHGAALLPLYAAQLEAGAVETAPAIEVVRDAGAVALLDAGRGLGHVPAMMAVDMAATRAEAGGIGAVAIRNSGHYGAAGVYARRLAERGLIGLSTSSVWRAAIVPTRGLEPRLGTNPFAFAAPSARGRPFLLDMATSTAAIGKIKLAHARRARHSRRLGADARGRARARRRPRAGTTCCWCRSAGTRATASRRWSRSCRARFQGRR